MVGHNLHYNNDNNINININKNNDKNEKKKEEKTKYFCENFLYVGHKDYSNFLVIPDCIKFINNICGGLNKMINYNHQQCLKMANYLVKFI